MQTSIVLSSFSLATGHFRRRAVAGQQAAGHLLGRAQHATLGDRLRPSRGRRSFSWRLAPSGRSCWSASLLGSPSATLAVRLACQPAGIIARSNLAANHRRQSEAARRVRLILICRRATHYGRRLASQPASLSLPSQRPKAAAAGQADKAGGQVRVFARFISSCSAPLPVRKANKETRSLRLGYCCAACCLPQSFGQRRAARQFSSAHVSKCN